MIDFGKIKTCEDAFGNLEQYFELDGIRLIIRDGELFGWYRPEGESAINVVRCKNCKKRNTDDCAMYYRSAESDEQYSWNNDNDFCSWGKAKEADETN